MNMLMQRCPSEPEAATGDYRHSGPLVQANMRIYACTSMSTCVYQHGCEHMCAHVCVQWALGVVWAWAGARERGRGLCLGRGQGLRRIELQVAVRVGTHVDLHARV